MGFRTLDLSLIMVHGANIRLSTMDLSILSQNKIALMTLDGKISADSNCPSF